MNRKLRHITEFLLTVLMSFLVLFSAAFRSLATDLSSAPSSEPTEPTSETETTEPAPKTPYNVVFRQGEDGGIDITCDYLLVTDTAGKQLEVNGNGVLFAYAGETYIVRPVVEKGSIEFANSCSIYYIKNGNRIVSAEYETAEKAVESTELKFQMPDEDIEIRYSLKKDEKLEESSVEESESIEASIKESESIEESIEFEKRAISYGGYTILYNLDSADAPEGFIKAVDDTTFDKTANAFYSTAYRLFVYSAERNGQKGLYVHVPMSETLMPFRTITDENGKKYVVTGAPGINTIPGKFRQESLVDISEHKDGSARVTGYVVEDSEGEQLVLLHLNGEDGKHGYYVIEDAGGKTFKLTSYTEYEAEKGISVEEPEDTETEIPTKAPDKEEGDFFSNNFVWFLIVGIIIFIIAAAMIIVFFMSKKQEEEEAELDSEENREAYSDEDEDDFIEFRNPAAEEPEIPFDTSSYSNSATMDQNIDSNPFDMNFENAFPDEVKQAAQQNVAPETHAEPEVSQVFDFTFDFGAEEPAFPAEEPAHYVEVVRQDAPKKGKESLSSDDFDVIQFKQD